MNRKIITSNGKVVVFPSSDNGLIFVYQVYESGKSLFRTERVVDDGQPVYIEVWDVGYSDENIGYLIDVYVILSVSSLHRKLITEYTRATDVTITELYNDSVIGRICYVKDDDC